MDSFKLHTFRPGETIDAVIKLLGRHNLTKAEMAPLRQRFNELNDGRVPRPGESFRIPSVTEVAEDSGHVEDAKKSESSYNEPANAPNDAPKAI